MLTSVSVALENISTTLIMTIFLKYINLQEDKLVNSIRNQVKLTSTWITPENIPTSLVYEKIPK